MKNQYVGDVRDFGKYGLLKHLSGVSSDDRWTLGVNWYLTPDDSSRDGAHTAYLTLPSPNAYVDADAALVQRLRAVVHQHGRDVRHIGSGHVFPNDTVFFDRLLQGSAGARDAWNHAAIDATTGCDLVFLDPDNGLEPASASGARPRPAHATVSEVTQYVERGQSVVVIQFFSRLAKHPEQVSQRLTQVARICQPHDLVPFAMLWRAHPALLFLVVPASRKHANVLRQRASAMVATPWGKFFAPPIDLDCQTGQPINPRRLASDR